MNSPAQADEVTDAPADESLVERLHRTSLEVERVRAKYETACNERDAFKHERDAAIRERDALAVKNAELQTFVTQLQDEVSRLTDLVAARMPDGPIKVTGPTRHAS